MAALAVITRAASVTRSLRWYRCFHCDEIFTDAELARLHFGKTFLATPACQVDAAHLREMEAQLARYHDEDTDLHRQIARMEWDHQRALRRAEEDGYAKGLRDGRSVTRGLEVCHHG
jgi:hypothetical protein